MSLPDASVETARGWAGFARLLCATAAGLGLALLAVTVVADPYGSRAGGGRRPPPLMDANQRYLYPALARSGRFDAAVFGTSTARLLDPARLGAAFGARVANLAVNAGTPWEQLQLARVFLRHVPNPRMLVFGLDRSWCETDADQEGKRVTARAFPAWLYDDDPWNDLPHLFNLRSLEIAARVGMHALGLMRPRIRADGYDRFTPPEASYDLARARLYLFDETVVSRAVIDGGEPRNGPYPALSWLAELLRAVPPSTRTILLLPPLHASAQPRPGSRGAAQDRACKAAILAAAPAATILDYRRPSPLTEQDANFWDRLHYRDAVAARIVDDLRLAVAGVRRAPDGAYEVLSGSP